MSNQHEFYLARAAEARADAESAKLDNVRERCLRSEAAWSAMAARVERSDRAREKLIHEKEAAAMASVAQVAVG
jgi:hypothetical protein